MTTPRHAAERQARDTEGLGLSAAWDRRPGEECLVVLQDPKSGARILSTMRWGLRLASSPTARPMLYLRAETAALPGPVREALRQRRCIVPVDGYVQRASEPSAPTDVVAISLADNAPIAMAGIWQDTDEGPRFALLTCQATEAIRPVHDRMPVILPPNLWPQWLDGHALTPPDAVRLLKPCPSNLLRVVPVDRPQKRRQPPRYRPTPLGEQLALLAPGAPVLRPGRARRQPSARRTRAEVRSKAPIDALG